MLYRESVCTYLFLICARDFFFSYFLVFFLTIYPCCVNSRLYHLSRFCVGSRLSVGLNSHRPPPTEHVTMGVVAYGAAVCTTTPEANKQQLLRQTLQSTRGFDCCVFRGKDYGPES